MTTIKGQSSSRGRYPSNVKLSILPQFKNSVLTQRSSETKQTLLLVFFNTLFRIRRLKILFVKINSFFESCKKKSCKTLGNIHGNHDELTKATIPFREIVIRQYWLAILQRKPCKIKYVYIISILYTICSQIKNELVCWVKNDRKNMSIIQFILLYI